MASNELVARPSGRNANVHRAEKIVSNTALYTGAVLVQKALSFLYFLFLSKQFLPHELGGYLWVLSLSGLFQIGIDLGLTPIVTREAARTGNVRGFVGAALALKIPLAATTVIVFIATVAIIRPLPDTLLMAAIAALIMTFDAFTMVYFAGLRAVQVLRYEALTLILFQGTVFAAGATVALTTHDLPLVMFALLIGSALNLCVMMWGMRRTVGTAVRPVFDRAIIRTGLLRYIPAFGASTIFMRVYAVADTILLGLMMGDLAVGLYAIPAKVATALQSLIPGAFSSSVYPSMSNYARHAPERLARLFERSVIYLLILALPVAAGLAFITEPLLARLWPEYTAAVPAFKIFMFGIPFIFLSYPTGALLNAVGREKTVTANRGIITGVNVALNLILIPTLGVAGAAVAYVVTNVLLFALDYNAARTSAEIRARVIIGAFVRLLVATAAMVVVVEFLEPRVPLPVSIGAGAFVYAAGIILLKLVGPGEWHMARALLKKYEENAPPHA